MGFPYHFQRQGAQLVVLEGVNRRVWENTWSEFCLDLHLMSCGAAQAMVHAWLLNVRSIVFAGRAMPEFLRYLMPQLLIVFVTFTVAGCANVYDVNFKSS
jgi:hypothetical protein